MKSEYKGTQTLSKGTYLMKGWIYVGTGSVLTIEPGTVIKGDKDTQAALIVEPGGKLIAEGTKDAPIVFTSEQPKGQRKPGDWGGLIICGNAKNNQGVLNQQIEGGPRTKHGGNDDADNSGILRYVRVEFAGYPFQKDKEINGITFGSVGSGTTIDHLQVSYSNDDSYEWFGGNNPITHDDVLYDAVNKQIIDAGQESYSSTFFKTQKGNKVLTDVNELKFKDGRNSFGVNYMPDADSPVLTAASFNDALLSSGFETVEYIGAFGTDDNWLDGWTNFDPNNTDY